MRFGGRAVAARFLKTCAAEPARALLATGVARRSQWRGAWPSPRRPRETHAFLVEPRDDMEEEAPHLKNAVAIPLSDARGLRHALAERVRHSMAVKKFAVTNELDVNVTLHWFDLEQEEGLRDHSPYAGVVSGAGRFYVSRDVRGPRVCNRRRRGTAWAR